jgi:hypothetical protein
MSVRNNDIEVGAVDAKWFLALKAIHRPLILHSLTPLASATNIEKTKVLSVEGYNPVFIYPHLNLQSITIALEAMAQLRLQVCQEESNKSIATLYTDKLDELILEQKLMLASVNGDWELFADLNKKLYGDLNSIFIKEQLEYLKSKTDFFNISFQLTDSEVVRQKPDDVLFQKAKDLIKGPDIIVENNHTYTSEQIVKTWNESLVMTMPEWRVVIDEQVVSILVVHKQRKVKIPAQLNISGKKMRKLFVHEIGTHVYRREMGKKNKFQLCSIGLAHNQLFEEGLATVRSQLLNTKFHQFGGLDKYLTLAIVKGYIDGVPKDFNQTFNILKEYYLDRLNRTRAHNETNVIIAENRAWNSSVRVFRGGNPAIAGCCFLRDKIYHEGNRAVWNLLREHSDYFSAVMLGKFDLANRTQREAVIEGALFT